MRKTIDLLDQAIADFEAAETAPDYNEAEARALENINRRMFAGLESDDFEVLDRVAKFKEK